ncbi:MAG: hypothetical protein EBR09_06025 [Proteobacteria bacterium]|jgi:hypothetical protein|nr:hypothetical protein [Pseudomonadota bacterium]
MEKKQLDQHHQTAGQNTIEPDNLPVKSISWFVVALVVIVAGTIIVMNQVYWLTSSSLVQTNELDVPNKLLESVRAADKQELEEYGEIDKQKGVYRLPVEEAMKIYVKKNGN